MPRWPTEEEIAALEGEHELARQIAGEFFAKVVPALKNVRTPNRELTRVTKYDPVGRILEFERKKVRGTDGRQPKALYKLAVNAWADVLAQVEGQNAPLADYLRMVNGVVGRGEVSFLSRLRSLAEQKDATAFWNKAGYWHGRYRCHGSSWRST